MDTLIHDFYMLGKCANRNVYNFTVSEVQCIRTELEHQLSTLMEKFEGKHRFTLNPEETDVESVSDGIGAAIHAHGAEEGNTYV